MCWCHLSPRMGKRLNWRDDVIDWHQNIKSFAPSERNMRLNTTPGCCPGLWSCWAYSPPFQQTAIWWFKTIRRTHVILKPSTWWIVNPVMKGQRNPSYSQLVDTLMLKSKIWMVKGFRRYSFRLSIFYYSLTADTNLRQKLSDVHQKPSDVHQKLSDVHQKPSDANFQPCLSYTAPALHMPFLATKLINLYRCETLPP